MMYCVPYGILFFCFLLAAVTAARRRSTAMHTDAVVGTLALILGQNLPLAEALRAAARHERRKLRSIFSLFAAYIEAGASVDYALRGAWPACPAHVLGALRGAREGGTLPSVARSLAAELEHEKAYGTQRSPALIYFLFLSLVISGMLMLYAVFLMPQINTILLDYGIQSGSKSNPLLESAFAPFNHFAELIQYGFPIFILILAILILLTLFRTVQGLFPNWFGNGDWLSAITGTIAWYLPGARQVAETRALGRQLLVLRAAIRAGQDIAPAADQAADAAPNVCARRRMRRWAEMIRGGADPRASANQLGMPGPLRRALANAHSPEELTAALDYLASYYRSLQAHWERMVAAVSVPVVVLFWGVFVAYFAMLVIVPLYSLLDQTIKDVF